MTVKQARYDMIQNQNQSRIIAAKNNSRRQICLNNFIDNQQTINRERYNQQYEPDPPQQAQDHYANYSVVNSNFYTAVQREQLYPHRELTEPEQVQRLRPTKHFLAEKTIKKQTFRPRTGAEKGLPSAYP